MRHAGSSGAFNSFNLVAFPSKAPASSWTFCANLVFLLALLGHGPRHWSWESCAEPILSSVPQSLSTMFDLTSLEPSSTPPGLHGNSGIIGSGMLRFADCFNFISGMDARNQRKQTGRRHPTGNETNESQFRSRNHFHNY